MEAMPRRTRIVTWNGKNLPPELRELPAGRYVVEAVEDEAPALSPEEEAGIDAALESYRQGRVVDAKRAREIIDAALGVEGQDGSVVAGCGAVVQLVPTLWRIRSC